MQCSVLVAAELLAGTSLSHRRLQCDVAQRSPDSGKQLHANEAHRKYTLCTTPATFAGRTTPKHKPAVRAILTSNLHLIYTWNEY